MNDSIISSQACGVWEEANVHKNACWVACVQEPFQTFVLLQQRQPDEGVVVLPRNCMLMQHMQQNVADSLKLT